MCQNVSDFPFPVASPARLPQKQGIHEKNITCDKTNLQAISTRYLPIVIQILMRFLTSCNPWHFAHEKRVQYYSSVHPHDPDLALARRWMRAVNCQPWFPPGGLVEMVWTVPNCSPKSLHFWWIPAWRERTSASPPAQQGCAGCQERSRHPVAQIKKIRCQTEKLH